MALGTQCRIHVPGTGAGLLKRADRGSRYKVHAPHNSQAGQDRAQNNSCKPIAPMHGPILSQTELVFVFRYRLTFNVIRLDAIIAALYTSVVL